MPCGSVSFFRFSTNCSLDNIMNGLLTRNKITDWIVVNEQGEDFFSGEYYEMMPRKESYFDRKSMALKIRETEKLFVTKFLIDYQTKIISLFGGNDRVNRFVTMLGQIVNNDISIDAVGVDIRMFIKKIGEREKILIKKIKIRDVVLDSNVVATCTVSLEDQCKMRDVLKKYINNISRVSVVLEDVNDLSLSVFESGRVVVYAKIDEFVSTDVESLQKELVS